MKLSTLVHHVHGYKMVPNIFQFLPRDLVMVFQSRKKGVKLSLNLERSPLANLKNLRQRFVDLPSFFHSAKTVCV